MYIEKTSVSDKALYLLVCVCILYEVVSFWTVLFVNVEKMNGNKKICKLFYWSIIFKLSLGTYTQYL